MTHYMMSEPTAPYRGQFVSRLFGPDCTVRYVRCVTAKREGGNGTIQYDMIVEDAYGENLEKITATKASDNTMHECPRWMCDECECFTVCICGQGQSD